MMLQSESIDHQTTISSHNAMNADQRRDPRYSMRDSQSIEAQLCNGASGRVVDISARGAKFEFDGQLPDSSSAKVSLFCNRLNWEFESAGTIHWRHPNRSDGWWIGCSFQDMVQPKALERLAIAGVIDRRIDDRQAINTDIQVKLEMQDATSSARLVDVSPGGFKLWLPHAVESGNRIVLAHVEDGEDNFRSVGRVCWTHPTGDGFFAGCSFVRREGYVHLIQELGFEVSSAPAVSHQEMTLAQGLSLAAGIGAVAFGIHGLFV